MATTPPTERTESQARPRRPWPSIASLSRTQRELIVAGAALATGVLVMPFLIFAAGSRFLGPYTHGDNPRAGPWALFADYVVGLAHGSAVFWVVALGPLALLVLIRGFLALLRKVPALKRE
ncbi:MAG TPA: hypothetical protein VEG26_09000 [Steroidobacteraceae bacterium]|nr:hypothetical protein [Steroidobacteraceae bacterium]